MRPAAWRDGEAEGGPPRPRRGNRLVPPRDRRKGRLSGITARLAEPNQRLHGARQGGLARAASCRGSPGRSGKFRSQRLSGAGSPLPGVPGARRSGGKCALRLPEWPASSRIGKKSNDRNPTARGSLDPAKANSSPWFSSTFECPAPPVGARSTGRPIPWHGGCSLFPVTESVTNNRLRPETCRGAQRSTAGPVAPRRERQPRSLPMDPRVRQANLPRSPHLPSLPDCRTGPASSPASPMSSPLIGLCPFYGLRSTRSHVPRKAGTPAASKIASKPPRGISRNGSGSVRTKLGCATRRATTPRKYGS